MLGKARMKLLASLIIPALAAILGQNSWCYNPPGSEQLFCDYVSYGSCRDAHRNEEGGVCVPRPDRR
jgi:hypothetical protein